MLHSSRMELEEWRDEEDRTNRTVMMMRMKELALVQSIVHVYERPVTPVLVVSSLVSSYLRVLLV